MLCNTCQVDSTVGDGNLPDDNNLDGPGIDIAAIAVALRDLLVLLPEQIPERLAEDARLRRLRGEIDRTIIRLEELRRAIDPVAQPPLLFDPSDPRVVGTLIARTMLERPLVPLALLPRFYGSGVYAIYYRGGFDAYQPVQETNTPLYVGKADPATSSATTATQQGTRLWGRLNDHIRSINSATNLDLADFDCRYLVVRSAWQNTAESYLITRFKPVWNNEVNVCFGFGKHGDAASTRSNTRSPWDTLHPGRPWATADDNVPNPLTPEQIQERIAEHYRQNPPERL